MKKFLTKIVLFCLLFNLVPLLNINNVSAETITQPTDLSDLVLWLDSDDASTLFTDNSCSASAFNGNTI